MNKPDIYFLFFILFASLRPSKGTFEFQDFMRAWCARLIAKRMKHFSRQFWRRSLTRRRAVVQLQCWARGAAAKWQLRKLKGVVGVQKMVRRMGAIKRALARKRERVAELRVKRQAYHHDRWHEEAMQLPHRQRGRKTRAVAKSLKLLRGHLFQHETSTVDWPTRSPRPTRITREVDAKLWWSTRHC